MPFGLSFQRRDNVSSTSRPFRLRPDTNNAPHNSERGGNLLSVTGTPELPVRFGHGNKPKAWPQDTKPSLRQRFHWQRTNTDDEALREAQAAIYSLLPPGTAVRCAEGPVAKPGLAFFEAGQQDSHLFIKVRRGGRSSGPWIERAITQQASAYGFSPRVFAAPRASQAIVSDFQKCPNLSFEQSQDEHVRTNFLDLMRRLHATTEGERPDATFDADVSDWREWRRKGLKSGSVNLPLLKIDLVSEHLERLLSVVEKTSVKQRFCHYDTIPRNIYWTPDGARLIDWELSRFGDPVRDLAKFFGSTLLQVGEVKQVLTDYYQRPPSAAEEQHLLRLVQAHTVDTYLHMVRSGRVQTEDLERKAEQIVELGCALSDSDTQHWWLDRADRKLVTRSALIAAANAAAKGVLGSSYKLVPHDLGGSARGCGTFRAKGASTHLFIKLEGFGTSRQPDAERNATKRAAEMQISPAFHPLPEHPFVIVTDNIDAPSLTFTQTLLPSLRQQLLAHLRLLHSSQQAPENLSLPELSIGGWTGWQKKMFATTKSNHLIFEVKQLERHMQAICDEIAATTVVQAPCHFDTLRRNMILADDRLWLIDWGLSRWGDPIRDLAKFFGFNGLFGHEASTMLSWYYERKPTKLEERHFLVLLQAMAVDHLSYMMSAPHDRMNGARHKVPQILSFAALLDDLPTISTV